MADEQTPQADLIDDAIRQAERQLEEKLEALRMSALGEPSAPTMPAPGLDAPAPAPAPEPVAKPAPAGSVARADEPASAPREGEAGPAPVTWQESGGDDVTFVPVDGAATHTASELYVPDADDLPDVVSSEAHLPARDAHDDAEHSADPWDSPAPAADPMREALTATVTDLVAVWDEDDEDATGPVSTSGTPSVVTAPVDAPAAGASADPTGGSDAEPAGPTDHADDDADSWELPEPVHTAWTGTGSTPATASTPAPVDAPEPAAAAPAAAPREPHQPAPVAAAPAGPVTVVPSEEEMQFWAHTRTALRNLQLATETVTPEIVDRVKADVERTVRSQLQAPTTALQSLQERLEAGLPQLAERIEDSIAHAAEGPADAIRSLRDHIPHQLAQTSHQQHVTLREELDHTAAWVHGAVQKDVAQLEQSIATNVTRMVQSTTDAVGTVGREVDVVGEAVARVERSTHDGFDRVEAQLRTGVERVEHSLRADLAEPLASIKQLDEQLPERLGRVERTLLEQIQRTQRDVSGVLSSLVDANRASLDRIAAVASTLDEDRARRADDVDVIVDTVTTGWEGLAGAVKVLYEQNEATSRRIAGIEQRLSQIRDLEDAVEGTISELRTHIRDLQPAPVVVTVAHPEAEVRNSARAGWLPGAEPG